MPSSLIVPGGRSPEPVPVNTTDPDPNAPIEVIVGFLVFQDKQSDWSITGIDTPLAPERDVTFDDMTAAAANLTIDVDVCYPERSDGKPVPVTTAFVVFQLPSGLWQIAPKIDAPLMPQREPTTSDFIGGLAVTARDVHTQEIAQMTAQATVAAQMQLSQAIAQQREGAALQAQLAADKQRRGGR